MAVGTKRRRPPAKGLLPGERLRRDKLAGSELHSQWGWVSWISDPSMITSEHLFTACGFNNTSEKPICKNKYSDGREPKEGNVGSTQDPKPTARGDEEDIIIVSSDDEEPYVCTKGRCKENPQCLNHLGQAKLENQDGALKSFLDSFLLGPSPFSNSRKRNIPVGLKNLGATCYANAFIQERHPGYSRVWFQDHAFRDGVYRCELSQEEGKDNEVSPIFQLQVTFTALQESTQNVFNPTKLVESLRLRVSEQQDAQEFSKLFMSHLAAEFEKQTVSSLKTLLSDQFEGKLTYGTVCQQCHYRSEIDMGFLELEINLETNAKLEKRIEALLKSEELTGDNKYLCPRCGSLQDAIRYTKLRRLPPVLHVSVLRFVFDITTLSRKKSKQTILFPSVLDMSPFVDAASSGDSDTVQLPTERHHAEAERGNEALDLVYELRGVLLHKGPSAYHGHYEAQVFDVTTRQFYQFNDEMVTSLTSLLSKNGVSMEDQKSLPSQKHRTYSRKKRRVDDSDCETENKGVKADHIRYTSSKDAYMLIYARRQSGSSSTGCQLSPEPPLQARRRVAELNRGHDIACASYMERERNLTTTFRLIRQKKMEICHLWQIRDFREESAVVSRRALEEWLIGKVGTSKDHQHPSNSNNQSQHTTPSQHPSAISDVASQDVGPLVSPHLAASPSASDPYRLDNSSIICHHGALDPLKSSEMKRINKDTLISIRNETNCCFDPAMTTDDICCSCVRDLFMEKRHVLEHASHVLRFDELCDSENDDEGAWVSKAWLRDWRQNKPKRDISGTVDPAPDDPEYINHVQCGHGQLLFSPLSRKWINRKASTFLQALFPAWCPIFSRIDGPCTSCSACDKDLSLSRDMRQELKQRACREKEKLRNILFSNELVAVPEIIPGVIHAIVPAEFMCQWRAWISRPQTKPRPGAIDNTWLICQHDCLNIDPNVPQDLGTSISLVSLADWEMLQDLYGGGPLISLTTHAQHSEESRGLSTISHNYEVCQKCRSQRLSNFETTTITIRMPTDELNTTEGQDSMKIGNAIPGASQKHINGGYDHLNHRRESIKPSRTSSRLRNSKKTAGRQHITIQKLSTVKDIKIELYEKLNIPTIYQRLFYRGTELTNSLETMASLGILADDILEFREEMQTEEMSHPDKEQFNLELEGRAFGGTALSGDSQRSERIK